jgi:hypothetical protein
LLVQKLLLGVLVVCACGGSSNDDESAQPDTIVMNAPDSPDATVAYSVDDGITWTVLAPKNGRYEIPTPVDAYTVVVACAARLQVTLYELHATDLESFVHLGTCRADAATISGTVAGATAARMYWGDRFSYLTSGSDAYTLSTAAGRHDLIAVRDAISQQSYRAERVAIARDVESASSNISIDLSDASGVATEAVPVTGVVYGDRSTAQLESYLLTANGTFAMLSSQLLEPTPPQIDVVPAASLETGDLNVIVIDNVGLSAYRAEERATKTVGNTVAVTFAPPNPTFEPDVGWDALDPYVLLHTYWKPEPGPMYRFVARQTSQQGELTWTINTTKPAVDGTGAFSWILPDLSGLPGWAPQLGFTRLQLIYWKAVTRSGAELAQLLQAYPTTESVIESSGWLGKAAP